VRRFEAGRIYPRLIRVITILAAAVSLLVMMAPPAAYHVAARFSVAAEMGARADAAAHVMSEFATRNPDHWAYEHARILGRLALVVETARTVEWQVLDEEGRVVLTQGPRAARPAISVSATFYDAGIPAGTVTVSRSIRDIMGWTVFLAVIGVALAGASFLLLRSLPLRLLAEATERLARLTEMDRERAAQLAQASKLAQLGEVATGMAHELNQPLTAIILAAENAQRLLARSPPGLEGAGARLNRILQMAQRAGTVIDHMRIFGRMGDGTSGPISIATAVRGAVELLAFKLDRHRIQMEVTLPEDLPPVIGQAVPLEQVMMNLIANACDAYGNSPDTAEEPPRLIGVVATASATQVSVTVQDRAGGIPPDVLPRIFDPFFTTKPVGQGTGLGLSISWGIINDMGGTLSAVSAEGGTTFTITLPAAQGVALDAA
jgi:signal transduction histidine kinase